MLDVMDRVVMLCMAWWQWLNEFENANEWDSCLDPDYANYDSYGKECNGDCIWAISKPNYIDNRG